MLHAARLHASHLLVPGANRRTLQVRLLGLTSPSLAKRGTTAAVAISKDWVFGGICREAKACIFVPVGQRDKDKLLPITLAHILPGTDVMCGMWKAYDYVKVSHSLNFISPNTGAHTQRIGNKWWPGSQTK